MSDTEYEVLTSRKGIHWFCNQCDINPSMPKEGVKTTPLLQSCGLLIIIFALCQYHQYILPKCS